MLVSQSLGSCHSRPCHRSGTRPPSNSLICRTKRTKKRPTDDLLAGTPSLRLLDFEEENLSALVETGLRGARSNSDPLRGMHIPGKSLHGNLILSHISGFHTQAPIRSVNEYGWWAAIALLFKLWIAQAFHYASLIAQCDWILQFTLVTTLPKWCLSCNAISEA